MNLASCIFEGNSGQIVAFNTDQIPIEQFSTTVETRREDRPKIREHGSWATNTYYGARTIHMEGQVLANNPGEAMQMRMQILGALYPVPELGFTSVGLLRMMIDGISEEIQGVANVDGEPEMPVVGGFPSAYELSIDFELDDPFLYGANAIVAKTGTPTGGDGGLIFPDAFPWVFSGQGASGDINITNSGNASAFPVITIYGPCTNPTVSIHLTNGIYTVGFNGLQLGAGDYVTIDMRARTAISNTGASVYHLIQQGSTWWRIPKGTWTVSYFAANVSAPSHAEITMKNAYLI